MTSQGSINELGDQYIGATTPNVSPNYVPGIVHGGSGSSGSSSVLLGTLGALRWLNLVLIALSAMLC